jgi:hypothetical protein
MWLRKAGIWIKKQRIIGISYYLKKFTTDLLPQITQIITDLITINSNKSNKKYLKFG